MGEPSDIVPPDPGNLLRPHAAPEDLHRREHKRWRETETTRSGPST